MQELKKDPDSVLHEKTIPGLSNLTYAHEVDWAINLRDSVEVMSLLFKNERLAKDLLDKNCPAMVLKTCRLVAHILTALGDTIHSLQAWNVVFMIAKMYDRKGLVVLSKRFFWRFTFFQFA